MSEMRRSMAARSQHPATGSQVRSVTKNRITWSFLDYETVGQYATGDYWVVGPVTITGITKPHATNGLDGSMINPLPSTNGYDSGFMGYGSPTYTASYDVSRSFPFTLSPGQSLVSTISWVYGEAGCPTAGSYARPKLRCMEVLTCVASAPSATAFRPNWSGNTKYNFTTDQITLSNLPGGVYPSLSVPSGAPTWAHVEGCIERPWLDGCCTQGDAVQYWSPSENMVYNTTFLNYGRDWGWALGRAALMLCMDPATVGSKTTVRNRLIQLGIDTYGSLKNGYTWPTAGALNYWRKLPVLLAGVLLNDSGMMGIGTTYAVSGNAYFAEDTASFYVTQADVDRTDFAECYIDVTSASSTSATGTMTRVAGGAAPFTNYLYYQALVIYNKCRIVSGTGAGQVRTITSTNQPGGSNVNNGESLTIGVSTPWSPAPTSGSRIQILSYEAADLGPPPIADWGIYGNYDPSWHNPSPYANYRGAIYAPAMGHVLAARVLGLKTIWNRDAMFDATDRWWNMCTANAAGWDIGNRSYFPYLDQGDWEEAVWLAHRSSY